MKKNILKEKILGNLLCEKFGVLGIEDSQILEGIIESNKMTASLSAKKMASSKEPSIRVIEDRRTRGFKDVRLREHLFDESRRIYVGEK